MSTIAIVGSAHVIIRGLTDKLEGDIQRALNNSVRNAQSSGGRTGRAFSDSFNANFDLGGGGGSRGPFDRIERDARRSGTSAGTVIGAGVAAGAATGARDGAGLVTRIFGQAGGAAGGLFSKAFSGSAGGGSSRMFISMALRIAALIPLLGALVGAISSVVSGLFAMGSAAANAVYAFAPLPGLIGALLQGGLAMMVAFGGVGAAVSAGLKPVAPTADVAGKSMEDLKEKARDAAEAIRDAAEAIRDAREDIRDAAEGIRDAQEALRDAIKAEADAEEQAAEMIKNATENVAEAKKDLKDVYEDTAEAEADAVERVADAEERLQDSHKRVQKAQENLTKARKAAEERLIDLMFATRGGAIAEKKAVMDLADAQWRLNATAELPADNRLRQEAVLAYEEAQLNLDQTRETNGDTAEELQEMRENGIEGSDAVVAAQEALAEAQESVRDSAEAVNDALKDQRELHKENAEAIKEAKERLDEMKDALKDAFEDAPEMVRDAREAVRDAKEAVRDAKEAFLDAQEALRDAYENLADARKGAADANDGFKSTIPTISAFETAMDKLSPPAQRFVMFLLSIKDRMAELRTAAAAGLFPGLQTAIETLVYGPLFPAVKTMLFETGQAVADAAISIANSLSSGPFIESFGNVTKQNAWIIRQLGNVVGDLAVALFQFMDAARPLTRELVNWLVLWADNLRVTTTAKNSTGELTDTIMAGGEQMKQLIRITKNLWEGIRDIGEIAAPSGQKLLDVFEKATERFANFTDNKKNVKTLSEQFDNIADNLRAISGLALAIGGAFFRLGADPVIGKLAKQLENMIPVIEGLVTGLLDRVGPELVEVVEKALIAFDEISKSGAIEVFLDTIITALDAIIWAFQQPVLGDGLRFLVKLGAAFYALSILTKFPGLKLVFNMFKLLGPVIWIVVRAIGAFLLTNPLGWFILLVTGLVLAYNKFDWFKKFVDDTAKSFIEDFAKPLIEWVGFIAQSFKDDFLDPIGKVIGAVVDWCMWLWDELFGHSIFPDLMDALKGFGEFFKDIFNALWKPIKDLGGKIKDIFGDGGTVRAAFTGVKNWLTGTFTTAWNKIKDNIIQPVLDAKDRIVGFFASDGPVRAGFNGIKNWITGTFTSAWNGIKDNIIQPVLDAKDRIVGFFAADGPMRAGFNGIKNWISDTWSGAWNGIEKIIKTPIEGAVNGIKNFFDFKGEGGPLKKAFDGAIAGITTIWDKIKGIAATPVNFVIGTVYNDGLRKAFNLLPGVDLKPAQTIPGYATGGVLPGYTPGRDVHKFYSPSGGAIALSGGEAIMRPEWVRAMGGEGAINVMNDLARKGRMKKMLDAQSKMAGYWLGGVIPLAGARYSQHTSGYPWAQWAGDLNVGAGYDDYGLPVRAWGSGTVHTVRNLGDTSYGRYVGINHASNATLYAHLSNFAASVGQQVAAGQVIGYVGDYGNTGTPPTSHLHFELTGAPVVGGGSGGSGGGGPAPGEAEKESWMNIIRAVPETLGKVKNAISYLRSGAGYFPLMADASVGVGNLVVDKINDMIPNSIEIPGPNIPLPDNPIPHFDSGGLARGKGWISKDIASPERVLSPRQTETFDRMVAALERLDRGGRGTTDDRPLALSVQVPQDASARDVVDTMVYELRRLGWGGKYQR